jgi:NAD(P)-dependent dehydrogenase (short-subunit alcohol dehydrogenase family)
MSEVWTWMITGASRGLGAALVRSLLDREQNVVASARRPQAVLDTHGEAPGLLAVALDVTDEQQARLAMSAALERFGRLDVLVNNAGYGLIGAIEETTDEDARRIFDTNVLGTLNVLRAALPVLRAQRSGRVITVGSLSGFRGAPGTGLYSGTKHALEGITESLRIELAPLGIEVMAVQPGAIRTDFLAPGSIVVSGRRIEDYDDGPVAQTREIVATGHQRQAGDADKMAELICDAAMAARMPPRLPLGADAIRVLESRPAVVAATFAEWRERSIATAHDDGALAPDPASWR